jgi:hypothetical protein
VFLPSAIGQFSIAGILTGDGFLRAPPSLPDGATRATGGRWTHPGKVRRHETTARLDPD